VTTQRIRKVGNSLVVTIPKEEVERHDLHEGDFVGLEVRKVVFQPQMSPELQAAFERSWETYQADYQYLAER
jgi:putative addiction module antidote